MTDAGEESLPYEIQVCNPTLVAGEEHIRDLFQFASLAKADPVTAEALFLARILRARFFTTTGAMSCCTGFVLDRA